MTFTEQMLSSTPPGAVLVPLLLIGLALLWAIRQGKRSRHYNIVIDASWEIPKSPADEPHNQHGDRRHQHAETDASRQHDQAMTPALDAGQALVDGRQPLDRAVMARIDQHGEIMHDCANVNRRGGAVLGDRRITGRR